VTETPPPPPSPGVLASMCASHAWSNDIDDKSRQLLEWAADVIRLCVSKSHKSASRAEKLEAERDHLLKYVAALTGAKK
jgi:hypothetical protein